MAAPSGCPRTGSRCPVWGAGSCRRTEPCPPACVCRSRSPSEQPPAGAAWFAAKRGFGGAGGRGGHRRGVTVARQELLFPPWPEGTPLCSAVVFQLDLGLGTVKPLLSRAASLDEHGGLLLKPLPARQPCRCADAALHGRAPTALSFHGLRRGAKAAPTLRRLQPKRSGAGPRQARLGADGPAGRRHSMPRHLSTLASFYCDSFSLLSLSSGQCQAS